jgi:hypothetical protein
MSDNFRCSYCNKSYSRKSWYEKHLLDCEKKKRFEQIHNMDFIRALNLFIHWRRRGGWLKRGEDTNSKEFAMKFTDHFMYKVFTDLAKFTTENWVITSIRYLNFCIDHHVADKKWTNEETLKLYREYIRRTEDPINQSKMTIQIIKDYCERNHIDRREFFMKVPTGTAYQMVIANQISPYVLFGYDRSREGLLSRVNDDWLCSVNQFINNKYWISKITGDTKRSIQAECERLFGDEA